MFFEVPRRTLGVVVCSILAVSGSAHGDDMMMPGPALPDHAVMTGNGEHRYETVPGWGATPDGSNLGPTHGGVAISKSGDVYVSTDGPHAIAVFSADGVFQRTIAPDCVGVHSLTIREENGVEYLYGAHLKAQRVVKLTLDGELVMEIKDTSEQPIPETFKGLTAVAVAPDGRIIAAVGYGSNIIHVFSAEGDLLHSFGSKGTELEQFRAAHGVAIDTRFDEPLLIIADRENRRLKHYDFSGKLMGVHSISLRRPCAISFWGDLCAVAELEGRVTILDKTGTPIAFLGDQPDRDQWANFKALPSETPANLFTAPHGLSYDAEGNLYVQDWNQSGRITKLVRVDG